VLPKKKEKEQGIESTLEIGLESENRQYSEMTSQKRLYTCAQLRGEEVILGRK
jgi:hypothetical protein